MLLFIPSHNIYAVLLDDCSIIIPLPYVIPKIGTPPPQKSQNPFFPISAHTQNISIPPNQPPSPFPPRFSSQKSLPRDPAPPTMAQGILPLPSPPQPPHPSDCTRPSHYHPHAPAGWGRPDRHMSRTVRLGNARTKVLPT